MCTRSRTDLNDHLANSILTKVQREKGADDSSESIGKFITHRRRVRFDTENHLIEPATGSILAASKMSETEKAQLFWLDDDFQGFKSNARDIATMVRRSNDSNQSNSYCNVLLRTHNSCAEGSKPSSGDTALLSHWIRVGTSRRGLEHWCSKTIGSSIRNRKTRVIDGVLGAQRAATVANLDVEQREAYIRDTCLSLSHSARIFAETMGKADEEAAVENNSVRKSKISVRNSCSSFDQEMRMDSAAISQKDQYLDIRIERIKGSTRTENSLPIKNQIANQIASIHKKLPGRSTKFQWQQQSRTDAL